MPPLFSQPDFLQPLVSPLPQNRASQPLPGQVRASEESKEDNNAPPVAPPLNQFDQENEAFRKAWNELVYMPTLVPEGKYAKIKSTKLARFKERSLAGQTLID